MPLLDNGYFIVSRTVVYKAPTDTVAPASTLSALDTPGTPWDIIGHIGDETASGNASFTRDGGDVTTKGSITKKAIRNLVDPVNSGIDIDLTQWTRGVLALYHGGDGGAVDGTFAVEGVNDGITTESAMLIVWEDGNSRVGLYAPRVSWTGRDNIDTDSIADAVVIPLHAGFLDSNTIVGPNSKPLRYSWLSPTLLAHS
jgi:hypothetical protein